MAFGKTQAGSVLTGSGWLSLQPQPFRDEVLRRGTLRNFSSGEAAFHFGDPPGGVYGLVSGTVAINTSPPTAIPRLIHVGMPGFWTGEGAFWTRQPRRVEMRAVGETQMMHLPLDAMDQMAAGDPGVLRCFALMLMLNVDTLIRIIHDLQQPEASRRIAAVLNRASPVAGMPLLLSQTELGTMANASRKQVNAALQRFAKAGWLSNTYRAITVIDPKELGRFAAGDEAG